MTDIDPADLPEDTRDGEVDPGEPEGLRIDGADDQSADGDIAAAPINEEEEDEE